MRNKKTLAQKAKDAILALDTSSRTMLNQVKNGKLNQAVADPLIKSAQKKAVTFRNAFLCGGNPAEFAAFDRSNLMAEVELANDRHNKMLKKFCETFGLPLKQEDPAARRKSLAQALNRNSYLA